MKDLGDLHCFLGVQVLRTDASGLFLSQNKYVSDLLRKFPLHIVKPVTTPVVSRVTLSMFDGELLIDPTYYRSMGALQYLTMNRPDIAYAGTLNFGIFLYSSSSPTVVISYSDVDWAGCPNTCRSTTGYVVFLGKNLISWRSKKQPIVSKSSTKAKYRVVAYIAAETIWLKKLLADIGNFLRHPVIV
ncbi:uncharacterized mitochondrial protein AtMg00810-like [Beta vulgaris subsp. vulgaris]|uniref:uncharacterized mitochondrial protein AtMg00810-like n=1 Tax=Beta vulgaris subsp. vulgaris TaxID=3555 RepID=UPI0025484F2F|nr:uncharacterized mitochondrial protein AtMg00810-like [Beta vulgaris subsp. vulgaris]